MLIVVGTIQVDTLLQQEGAERLRGEEIMF